ncbi:hypothetical protein [Roseateles sp.]|uniref:hypothetical protein n=1 Tax=Roseateles sp. TaxID=1971397 RepID=UPI0031E332B3
MTEQELIEREAAAAWALAEFNSRAALGQSPDVARARQRLQLEQRLKSLEAQHHQRDHAYGGTVRLTFAGVWGEVIARINFANDEKWEFSGECWGIGAGTASAAGGGPWGEGFLSPYEGQEMRFEIFSAQSSAGIVQIFWWIKDQPIVGAFIGPAGGLGALVAGGSGRWRRA